MPTFHQIQQQLQHIPESKSLWSRQELSELPNILWQDEQVENIIQGVYNNGSGILVATNRRLVFVDKGVFSLKVEDFPYDKITSIQYETGFIFGKLTIYASGNRAVIDNVAKDRTRQFGDWVRARISSATSKPSGPAAAPVLDIASQLEKLADLKARGILTEAEFQTQKQKLLA